MATKKPLLMALATFAAEVDGVMYAVHAGDVVPPSHPAVKGREQLFEPVSPVETATAAPGERRRR